jgi:2,3-bisphosphoglycerate-independent phosphoglycerate mutase
VLQDKFSKKKKKLIFFPSRSGIRSDGGVHSHIQHLFALLKTAKEEGVPHVYVHFFGDGRDTAPCSADGYCQQLLDFMKKEEVGELATIVGRYYAMDCNKHWECVKITVDGFVKGEGEDGKGQDGIVDVIKQNYKKDITDEFLKPIIVNGDEGRIKGELRIEMLLFYLTLSLQDGDTLFSFNYRSDCMCKIVSVLGLLDKPMEVEVPKDIVSSSSASLKPRMLI